MSAERVPTENSGTAAPDRARPVAADETGTGERNR